jgi:hypothetical protein
MFKIYTNKEEIVNVLTYIISCMKQRGTYPSIKDVEQYYEVAQVMIARERIQICLNVVHSGVDITHRKTSIDYAIDSLPEIKATSTTMTATDVTAEPALEHNNDSLSSHSSLSPPAAALATPPSDVNNTKPTKPVKPAKRTAPTKTSHITSTDSSTPINECPTPVARRLRGRKQIINGVTSPSSDTKISDTTSDDTPQPLTSSSSANDGRLKKRSSKLITPAVCDEPKPKKKAKTKRRN